jgi:hypothetical protein
VLIEMKDEDEVEGHEGEFSLGASLPEEDYAEEESNNSQDAND